MTSGSDPAESQENPTYLAPSACVARRISGTNACSARGTFRFPLNHSISLAGHFFFSFIQCARLPLILPTTITLLRQGITRIVTGTTFKRQHSLRRVNAKLPFLISTHYDNSNLQIWTQQTDCIKAARLRPAQGSFHARSTLASHWHLRSHNDLRHALLGPRHTAATTGCLNLRPPSPPRLTSSLRCPHRESCTLSSFFASATATFQ